MLRVQAKLVVMLAAVATLAAVAILATAGGARAVPGSGPAAGVTLAESATILETTGPYYVEFLHSGKCANNPGASTANVWLIQYTCGIEWAGLWYLDKVAVEQPTPGTRSAILPVGNA